MGHQSYVLLCTETTLSNHQVVLPKSSCEVHLLRSPWPNSLDWRPIWYLCLIFKKKPSRSLFLIFFLVMLLDQSSVIKITNQRFLYYKDQKPGNIELWILRYYLEHDAMALYPLKTAALPVQPAFQGFAQRAYREKVQIQKIWKWAGPVRAGNFDLDFLGSPSFVSRCS